MSAMHDFGCEESDDGCGSWCMQLGGGDSVVASVYTSLQAYISVKSWSGLVLGLGLEFGFGGITSYGFTLHFTVV